MEDRRHRDRRRQIISLRLPDRRYGFPRREPQTPLGRRYVASLEAIRDNSTVVALLASLLLALNLADLTLTQRALSAGAIEANPFMAALFEADASLAAAAKLGLSALVVGSMWLLRRYKAALVGLVLMVAAMGILVAYQALLVAAIT